MHEHKRSQPHDRGASLVEFAIVLPLFLLLIGGMIDFGHAFYTKVMLTNAAREGARTAMYAPADLQSAVEQRAWAAAGCGPSTQCDTAHPVVIDNACPSPAVPTEKVTVTVKTQFEWTILAPIMNWADSNSTLSGKATMQCGG